MKIVFLSASAQLGGAERSLLDILASLHEADPGLELHLIASAEGPLLKRAAAAGAGVEVVPFPAALAELGDAAVRGPAGDRVPRRTLLQRILRAAPEIVGYRRRLRRRLGELAPDVIHSNGFKMHILGLWSRPGSTPVVWHIHDYVSSRPVMSRLLRWCARRAGAVVANSRSVAADVRSVCGDHLPVHLAYNAVNLDAFSPQGPVLDLDALAGLPPAEPGTVRVGLVATLGRWKGHAVFLQALSRLPPTLPVRGYVVGGALYQTGGSQYSIEDLRQLAQQLGVGERVGFTGFVEEPAAAMRALDIVVHASTQPEPFGLVIIEAMGCGKPVVASEAGGSAELFSSGTNALGYPPGDAEALAACIVRLAEDAALRARIGQEGRATVEQSFNRSRLSADLIPIYRDVTAAVR